MRWFVEGIFVLTGIVAAEKTGPAIVLSYLFVGIAMTFTALCYAEFATRYITTIYLSSSYLIYSINISLYLLSVFIL